MLENFHNTLLAYCAKRTAFRYVYIDHKFGFYLNFSDTAYRARIQLAVLDHNAHLDRNPKQRGENQGLQYHRRYRKQTCNWDVVKVLDRKEYKYIPELMTEIMTYWQQSGFNMHSQTTVPPNHPTRIQSTIAHNQPPDTHTIANNKKSRFQ